MLTGRKIMHASGTDSIAKGREFLPHESFVLAPGGTVEIDFPDATRSAPTTCLTVEISKEKVNNINDRLNYSLPMLELSDQWLLRTPVLHTHHSTETQRLLSRLIKLFTENHPDRDILIDLNISELIIRMLRHKTRDFLLTYCTMTQKQTA